MKDDNSDRRWQDRRRSPEERVTLVVAAIAQRNRLGGLTGAPTQRLGEPSSPHASPRPRHLGDDESPKLRQPQSV
jgi:hypothetical protein